MKKPKTLETKLRSALRFIWSRSSERRIILKAATIDDASYGKSFVCPICGKKWPIQMAEVDHEPPIGELLSWRDTVIFLEKMFYGPQRVVCKICHRKKTNEQRKKKGKK